MFEDAIRDGVLQLRRDDVRALSTGWGGGIDTVDAIYNLSVPDGFDETDLDGYVRRRRLAAGFDVAGPALLTGVDLAHLRGARCGSAVVYSTAGLSNPATLPMDPRGHARDGRRGFTPGTVNLIVAVSAALTDATLAELLAVTVEAKTATLLSETGFSGTTTDAVVVACDRTGPPARFVGSATVTGSAVRACVRDAVRASLRSRYADSDLPGTVDEAEYGVTTTRRAEVFQVDP